MLHKNNARRYKMAHKDATEHPRTEHCDPQPQSSGGLKTSGFRNWLTND